MKIRLENIIPDPDQPRKTFDDEKMTDLQGSMGSLGLIQPITVRPWEGGGYMIVVGERRFRAALMDGVEEIECIVRRDVDDKKAREMQFAENYHCESLSPLEQAEGWARHIKVYGINKAEFARLIGVHENTVKQSVTMVTNLAPELVGAVRDGSLTKSYAEVIAPVVDRKRQVEIAKPIMDGKISGPKTFEYLSKVKADPELEPESVAVRVVYNSDVQKVSGRAIIDNLKRERAVKPAPPEGKYRTITIDPPWSIEKILRDERPNQFDIDYPTMSLDEIAGLPVPDLADDDGCHIYLWTTHKHLPDALDLLGGWGAEYQCLLTWVKNVGFTPFSFMYSTEHCLFAHIGSLPLLQMGRRLDFSAKVREHSRKPDEFYNLVRDVSPEPRLDMFGREQREGFVVWGNEANRFSKSKVA